MLGLMAAGSLLAQSDKVSTVRTAEAYAGPRVGLAMWIWSDKYTYTAGQNLQLKWTVKPNNDLYPYTMFVYRQNNQTGVKTYFPGNSTTVTDFTGKTAAQGYQPAQMTAATKATLLNSVAMPNEPGMHTFVVELRDYSGNRILKSAYMKVGVITGVETITSNITGDRTLTNDKQWNLQGIIYVTSGTLTIQPGTFIVGLPGSNPASALIVSRNATIEARGTRSRPIIMTSAAAFGQRTRGGNGGWGGLVLLGKAPVNVPANAVAGGATNSAGEFFIEGVTTEPNALYGGNDPTHYCGTLQYVRVEFAGSILAAANELNSFTFGSCGSKTVLDHLQAHYGLDDAFEWFGGTANAKYLIAGLHADDFVDYQLGYTGKVQHGIFYQSPALPGNRGIEGDNSEYNADSTPISDPTMYNLTFLGSGVTSPDTEGAIPGIYLRRNTRGTFNNMVVQRFAGSSVFFNEAATQNQATGGFLKLNGNLMWNNNTLGANKADTLAGNFTGGNAAATTTFNFIQTAPNVVVGDPLLTRPFEYSDPDFTSLAASPVNSVSWIQPPDDGFFDQWARYAGGVGSTAWWEEWTFFPTEGDIAP
jgi:hypothetical protein